MLTTIDLNKKELETFFKLRWNIIIHLEIAVVIFQKVTERIYPPESREQFLASADEDGNIYQFFAFLQSVLTNYIVIQIGSIVDKKKWEKWKSILPHEDNEKIGEIRDRYKIIRDKFTAHCDDDHIVENNYTSGDPIPPKQVFSDVNALKTIFIFIQKNNLLPPNHFVARAHTNEENYPYLGLDKIFETLYSSHI